ncbi:hypothetical protein FRC12_006488 [Ceratobasidium sp. 428]|nr:hypothetical protein FRC12_006488 [Ceratobasidium sp. 428]
MGGRLLEQTARQQKSTGMLTFGASGRSGEGYRIKNCLNGMYLAIKDTSCEPKPQVRVFGGRYPTTWELNQGIEDHEMYIIKGASVNRIIELDDNGKAHDGNQLHMRTQDRGHACKRWRFERLSDDTGEEGQKLLRVIQGRNEHIKEQSAQLDERNRQIAENSKLLAQLKEQLESRGKELDKVKVELNQKSTLLLQTQDALRRASDSLATRNSESLRVEVQSIHSRLEGEQSQRKETEGKLEERVESLERMVAEVSIFSTPRRNSQVVTLFERR